MKLFKNLTRSRVSLLLLLVAAIVVVAYMSAGTSSYSVAEQNLQPSTSLGDNSVPAPLPTSEGPGCQMKVGTGLASSLLPREVASQEEFGEFAPEDILAGQNFLEPRQQIGFPETVGGALRNANHQVRADPPNNKDNFVWNNSTISPDTMQRGLCA